MQTPPRVVVGVAAAAAALMIHLLTTAVRSRHRDLALLASLGFTRRQLRSTVGWHASVVAVLASAIGVPLGIAVGRSLWRVFADRIHAGSPPEVPLLWSLLALPIALVVANVVAAVPARLASRTQPAVALRHE